MKNRAPFLIGLAFLLGWSFGGCAYLEPIVQDINLISPAEEQEIGNQMASQVAAEMPLVQAPTLLTKIRGIGDQLESVVGSHPFNYQFNIVQDKTPNAFTIPAGYIYVHTGLLDFTSSDNELAGVIAHEIGHAYERHPTKSLTRAYGIQYLTSSLFKGNEKSMRAIMLQLAGGGVLSKYSREDELEADAIGFELLRRTGMSTNGLISFLTKLQTLQGRGSTLPFLSSHPPTPERIERLKRLQSGQTN